MKTITLSFLLLLVALGTKAQIIQGVVTDSASLKPLEAVTITAKSNKKSTITNQKGKFRLLIADTDTLILQRIGYQTIQQTVSSDEGLLQLNMALKANNLSDVMVNTGYQTLPKERATGSFELISNKDLNRQVSGDIISRLDGTSSVLFDNGTQRPHLTIRGLSSIYGDKAPLIVLNNFPYEGNINNINPDDVESITILKDAAAASIWGTRASNGVIVITTKKGNYNQPLKVSINSSIKIMDKPNLDYIRQISSPDYIDLEKLLFEKEYRFSDTANLSRPAFSPAYEILFQERNGLISHETAENELTNLGVHSVFDDFDKYIYQTASMQQYTINIDGGSQKDAYHIDAGYNKQVSNLDSKYDRLTLHLENTIRPIKSLELKTSLMYNRTNTASGKPSYENLRLGLYPYAQFASTDGTPLAINHVYRRPYIDTIGSGHLLDWHYYPLEDYKHARSSAITEDVVGNVDLQYHPTKTIKLLLQYQYERQQNNSKNLSDPESFSTRDMINKFTQIDHGTGQVTYKVPYGGILSRGQSIMESNSVRGQINYHETFGDHDVSVLMGSEIRDITDQSDGSLLYGYDDEILTFGNVDFINPYPTIIPGYSMYIPNGQSESQSNNRFVSVFANGAYTFKQRYIFSASARRDASNLFGVNTNDKWTPLWSVGGSWIINKERFWQSNTINYLKLRATYGFSGNVNQGASAVTTLQYFGNDPNTNFNMSSIVQFGNPDLRWEKTGILNIGLDFAIKNDILSGSIEYYKKKSKDLFGYAPIDYTTTGSFQMLYNTANMSGQGWDFSLLSTPIKAAVGWNIALKGYITHSEITKYFLAKATSSSLVSNGISINPLVGYPIFGIVSYKWAGLDPQTGDPQGILDGEISKDYTGLANQDYHQLTFSGSATPTFYGSFLNSISYQNLTLSANIVYRMGYYYRKPTINYYDLIKNGYGDLDYYNRWQQPGDEKKTNVPSMEYPLNNSRDVFYLYSDILAEKADNIRLQYVSISYLLSHSSNQKMPFDNMSITAMINNPGILWRAGDKTIDPDYPNTMAPTKSFSLALKFTF